MKKTSKREAGGFEGDSISGSSQATGLNLRASAYPAKLKSSLQVH